MANGADLKQEQPRTTIPVHIVLALNTLCVDFLATSMTLTTLTGVGSIPSLKLGAVDLSLERGC